MNWLRVNGGKNLLTKFGISIGILMIIFYVRCATKIRERVTKI
jgi:hypothetical protein